MENQIHRMIDLFAQLGLENSTRDIQRFIDAHRPLPPDTALHEASFWNRAQADFLRESVQQDADWAEIIDELSVALRAMPAS